MRARRPRPTAGVTVPSGKSFPAPLKAGGIPHSSQTQGMPPRPRSFQRSAVLSISRLPPGRPIRSKSGATMLRAASISTLGKATARKSTSATGLPQHRQPESHARRGGRLLGHAMADVHALPPRAPSPRPAPPPAVAGAELGLDQR
jgi:hypothetical protein